MGNSKSKSSTSSRTSQSESSSSFSTAGTILATAIGAGAIAAAAYAAFSSDNNTKQTPHAHQSSVTHARPLPIAIPAPKEASRLVIFSANDYVISSNAPVSFEEFIPNINVPSRSKVDKFAMRVCPQYNSFKGCNFNPCYRFHLCQFWVNGVCKKNDCKYAHSFNSSHNRALHDPHLRKNFGGEQLLEVLKKGSYVGKTKAELVEDCICIEHILKKCMANTCNSHHLTPQFIWEISVGDNWVRFIPKQNIELEKAYCDPKNINTILPKLPPCDIGVKPSLLHQAVGEYNSNIDFEKLSLMSSNSFFRIRRLSTPSDILHNQSVATRWLWYWQVAIDEWLAFSSGAINDYFIIPLSDHLEFLYLKSTEKIDVTIDLTKYLLNFESMTLTNTRNLQVHLVRRRPMLISVNEKFSQNATFRSIWTKSSDESVKFERMLVSSSSLEYSFVTHMLMNTLLEITDITVERIENPFLWESYQLKKAQYLDKYNGDIDKVNEQYLFHGTQCSVVDKICTDGFDWRLFGSNVGSRFGHGTYFSNDASYSHLYTSVDSNGYSSMFIALVLVGLSTLGDSNMDIPPNNIVTNKRFDTTVNDDDLPNIFVKYDLDEYYPAYYIRYKGI